MQEKVVKFEIGKILAVVIAVVAVTALAGVAIQSDLFQGNMTASQVKELCEKDPKNSLCAELNEKELDRLKACDYNQAELEEMSGRPNLTSDQEEQIKICLNALLTPITLNEKEPEENVSIPLELDPIDPKEENVSIPPELDPIDPKEENVSIPPTPVESTKESDLTTKELDGSVEMQPRSKEVFPTSSKEILSEEEKPVERL